MVVAPTYLLHSTNIRGYGCYEGETERHRRGEIITLGLRWKYGGNTVEIQSLKQLPKVGKLILQIIEQIYHLYSKLN